MILTIMMGATILVNNNVQQCVQSVAPSLCRLLQLGQQHTSRGIHTHDLLLFRAGQRH